MIKNMKIIPSALVLFHLTFSCISAIAQDTYTLLEGKAAKERLDIQNEFNRGILIKAFTEVSSITNIEGMTVLVLTMTSKA